MVSFRCGRKWVRLEFSIWVRSGLADQRFLLPILFEMYHDDQERVWFDRAEAVRGNDFAAEIIWESL